MNKELIKKYKTEFDYWLNDGDIIVIFTNGSWIKGSLFDWVKKDLDCDIKYIVINDEYVEFRKVIAEGKTVQCNRSYGEFFMNPPIWEDISIQILNNFSPKFLRIKPEEQFKVGDWLFDLQYKKYYRIENVLEEKVETAQFRIWKSSINGIDYEIWKPKPGELVIMKTDDYSTGFTVTQWEKNSKFTPVPFTGELPK